MRLFAKVLLFIGLLLIFSGFLLNNNEVITIVNRYFHFNSTDNFIKKNEYYRNYDFLYVQNTYNFYPQNYQELLNVYYTVINSGVDSFSFYCGNKYDNCLEDVEKIANDRVLLSSVNNFVHPYNSYSNIEIQFDTLGKISLKIDKLYNDSEIKKINERIDALLPELTNSNNTSYDNIKNIHDYIINNTKYDLRSEDSVSNYHSNTAYGPLFDGYAICGGYTDLMQLFLERLNIKSYRISTDIHVWNAINIDNKWYHLDLTWDDPVSNDNVDRLTYEYFLIDNDELKKEPTQHNFNKNIFLEFKETN